MTYRVYTEIEVEEHSSLLDAIESALEQDMGPGYEGDSGFRRPWVETEDGEVVWAADDFDYDRWPAELSAEQVEELKAVKSMFDGIWDR